MKIGAKGLTHIKSFEGFVPNAYLDPVGIPTIGYGATYYQDGTPVRMGDAPITEAQALALLAFQVGRYADAVARYVQVPLAQEEFDALTSFTFNLGPEALRRSTLLRKLNAGDYRGAADEFPKWNMAGGRVYPGLTRRRMAERALFLGGRA